MRIEFAYAQARVRARLGARVSEDAWQMLGAADSLAQYLHGCRQTPAASHVQHLTPSSSPHVIERSLRRQWREAVAEASGWSPQAWREAIDWTAGLPDLEALRHVASDGERWSWMEEGPALSEPRELQPEGRPRPTGDALESWERRWRSLWPDGERQGLEALVGLLRAHRRDAGDASIDARGLAAKRRRLERRVTRMIRGPDAGASHIFAHLVLTALELGRLRAGLVPLALAGLREQAVLP